MMKKKIVKAGLIFPVLFGLSACVGNGSNISKTANPHQIVEVKEKLYQSTSNYNQLINLYRKTLSEPAFQNEKMQNLYLYKLSEAYFAKKDYSSALLYMQKLLNNPEYKQRIMVLELKTFVEMGKYNEALEIAKNYHITFPASANVYNSQGIAYAELGKYDLAKESFNQARSHFLNDVVALNNLAMLAIIESEYKNAVRLLLPQYLNGEKNQRLIFNLVFALIKSGDVEYARQIIEKEKLSTDPIVLINSLKKTKRLPHMSMANPATTEAALKAVAQEKERAKAEAETKAEKASAEAKTKISTKTEAVAVKSTKVDDSMKTLVIRKDESLAQLFHKHHLNTGDMLAIRQLSKGKQQIDSLKPGQEVQVYLTKKGNISKMVLPSGSFVRETNGTYRYQY